MKCIIAFCFFKQFYFHIDFKPIIFVDFYVKFNGLLRFIMKW